MCIRDRIIHVQKSSRLPIPVEKPVRISYNRYIVGEQDVYKRQLLDTPQSAALIQQLLPELAQYVQQEPGSRGISVNDLQFYSNKMFDEEKLAALNEALAKLN